MASSRAGPRPEATAAEAHEPPPMREVRVVIASVDHDLGPHNHFAHRLHARSMAGLQHELRRVTGHAATPFAILTHKDPRRLLRTFAEVLAEPLGVYATPDLARHAGHAERVRALAGAAGPGAIAGGGVLGSLLSIVSHGWGSAEMTDHFRDMARAHEAERELTSEVEALVKRVSLRNPHALMSTLRSRHATSDESVLRSVIQQVFRNLRHHPRRVLRVVYALADCWPTMQGALRGAPPEEWPALPGGLLRFLGGGADAWEPEAGFRDAVRKLKRVVGPHATTLFPDQVVGAAAAVRALGVVRPSQSRELLRAALRTGVPRLLAAALSVELVCLAPDEVGELLEGVPVGGGARRLCANMVEAFGGRRAPLAVRGSLSLSEFVAGCTDPDAHEAEVGQAVDNWKFLTKSSREALAGCCLPWVENHQAKLTHLVKAGVPAATVLMSLLSTLHAGGPVLEGKGDVERSQHHGFRRDMRASAESVSAACAGAPILPGLHWAPLLVMAEVLGPLRHPGVFVLMRRAHAAGLFHTHRFRPVLRATWVSQSFALRPGRDALSLVSSEEQRVAVAVAIHDSLASLCDVGRGRAMTAAGRATRLRMAYIIRYFQYNIPWERREVRDLRALASVLGAVPFFVHRDFLRDYLSSRPRSHDAMTLLGLALFAANASAVDLIIGSGELPKADRLSQPEFDRLVSEGLGEMHAAEVATVVRRMGWAPLLAGFVPDSLALQALLGDPSARDLVDAVPSLAVARAVRGGDRAAVRAALAAHPAPDAIAELARQHTAELCPPDGPGAAEVLIARGGGAGGCGALQRAVAADGFRFVGQALDAIRETGCGPAPVLERAAATMGTRTATYMLRERTAADALRALAQRNVAVPADLCAALRDSMAAATGGGRARSEYEVEVEELLRGAASCGGGGGEGGAAPAAIGLVDLGSLPVAPDDPEEAVMAFPLECSLLRQHLGTCYFFAVLTALFFGASRHDVWRGCFTLSRVRTATNRVLTVPVDIHPDALTYCAAKGSGAGPVVLLMLCFVRWTMRLHAQALATADAGENVHATDPAVLREILPAGAKLVDAIETALFHSFNAGVAWVTPSCDYDGGGVVVEVVRAIAQAAGISLKSFDRIEALDDGFDEQTVLINNIEHVIAAITNEGDVGWVVGDSNYKPPRRFVAAATDAEVRDLVKTKSRMGPPIKMDRLTLERNPLAPFEPTGADSVSPSHTSFALLRRGIKPPPGHDAEPLMRGLHRIMTHEPRVAALVLGDRPVAELKQAVAELGRLSA